ncbi:hypothetical protein PHSY_007027 [Pseudozyma hubeiensis SY62]|uniref:Uncharacterized protein n=1 Tax=Pseudozyma hubeiensis (strain SY62) TaxID=1305764 RepID=R9PDK2_PSEHS|nr:hypothetical protein PHSY_007027 [Pseudozyma hubeiensis SY62]GAC99426.1 hypothetical protein PHSY_007027 [Pseudozyma hubeiensis SY62]
MNSPVRSFTRDEAAATSPLRNAFASSSIKPLHSPFLARRLRASGPDQRNRSSNTASESPRQPDAISTSSSTLVNAESTSDYQPWEVRSESNTSSLDSFADSRGGGRDTPTLSALEEIGTLPSIHITPLTRRPRTSRSSSASARTIKDSTRRSADSGSARTRSVRQLCPVDCRCSDQDIDLGLCRRVVGESSSGSESGSLSVGVHPMRQRQAGAMPASSMDSSNAELSQQSAHSQTGFRSQGRDFEKDPILVPRSARSRAKDTGGPSPDSNHQRSFDQLQRGLDTLESNESDAESDADRAQAAQRRAESMARWTARRASLSHTSNDRQSPPAKLDLPSDVAATKASPIHSTARSLASDASISRRTPGPKLVEKEDFGTPISSSSSPLKSTPGRKSIAAVFESMQREREARAAEEHRQWQEKQVRRERERAARAFGAPLRRRSSATSSQFDSPVSASTTAPDTSPSQGQATAFHSIASRFSPSRSPASVVSASPLLSSPGSPKVDEGAAADVESRHLREEAAERIPETLAEDDEVDDQDVVDDVLQPSPSAAPTTPQSKPTTAFAFSSQPMALDLSPVRSVSDISSAASSPRKNAHRRQNTNTVSVVARLPTASVGAARQRLNHVLGQTSTPPVEKVEPPLEFPQTPVGGILSSAKKGLPQLSAARRGHSVRFSPRPDYRSDSGSWDESQTNDGEREAVVERLFLPSKEIVIPEVLAGAPVPAHFSVGTNEEEEDNGEEDSSVEDEERERSPVSQPHIISPRASTEPAAASFSQSVRFPGAYAATPTKNYSRHIIRPSPKIERVLPDVIPAAVTRPLSSAAKAFGLFPAFDPSADLASSIPRESTPPPSTSSSSSKMLAPNDPRNSPRSPRPVDLGREQFARFDAGSSSSVSSGEDARQVDANTAGNGQVRGRGGQVDATISRILQTVSDAHDSRVRRMQLGQKLDRVNERMDWVAARKTEEKPSPRPQRIAKREFEQQDEQDRLRMDEVKTDVMNALAVLADRIVQLQSSSQTLDTALGSTSNATSTTRSGLSRRTSLLLVLLQCILMAWLLESGEIDAE